MQLSLKYFTNDEDLRIYLFSCLFYRIFNWRKIKGKGKGEGDHTYPSTPLLVTPSMELKNVCISYEYLRVKVTSNRPIKKKLQSI